MCDFADMMESPEGEKLGERLGDLEIKIADGDASAEEKGEYHSLRKILTRLHIARAIEVAKYRRRNSQGKTSVKGFDLNRDDLAADRQSAYLMAEAALLRAHTLLRQGHVEEATGLLAVLARQPYASGLQEIIQISGRPIAKDLLDPAVVAALTDPDLLAVLRNVFPQD